MNIVDQESVKIIRSNPRTRRENLLCDRLSELETETIELQDTAQSVADEHCDGDNALDACREDLGKLKAENERLRKELHALKFEV